MKIITISAHAQNGKDASAILLKAELARRGNRVLIAHNADLLKYICKSFFKWDGVKDENGRTILQHVGTEGVRSQNPDYWVNFLIGIFKLFPNEWDYAIIPDTRFPNEIKRFMDEDFDVTTVKVIRPYFDNGLTDEQKNHSSETALDDFGFDYILENVGDLIDLEETVKTLADNITDNMGLED